jgi:hypothetical protein
MAAPPIRAVAGAASAQANPVEPAARGPGRPTGAAMAGFTRRV